MYRSVDMIRSYGDVLRYSVDEIPPQTDLTHCHLRALSVQYPRAFFYKAAPKTASKAVNKSITKKAGVLSYAEYINLTDDKH